MSYIVFLISFTAIFPSTGYDKTNTREFFKGHQIALILRTRAILMLFEKLTRARFIQIALETILLPILIA